MAYDNSQLRLLVPGLSNGAVQVWDYRTTDAIGTVNTAGYFSDYVDMGIRPGDIIFVRTFTNTTWAVCSAINIAFALADGDITDGLAITATDTD